METSNPQQLQSEISRLQSELQMREQLVEQLSAELFRLVKGNTNFTPAPEVSQRHQEEMEALREQLRQVEEQVAFYQEQLENRDEEIYQLRQTNQELTDRSRMLEQVVQDLPEIYRQKFQERIQPVTEQLEQLQKENRRLHAELQSVSYRLALRSKRSQHLELPSFRGDDSEDGVELPSFGNA
ncbi:Npun_F5560 family protein [Geitlerinema sp. PCC 9228]|jgi:chromosome segregation ATPase|uniref:Npun_F5560 family protein n=1 Tax=Geitlerinema sp. PCC 9228 TaxID=111611 RepID=UPI0008F9D569|nr:Npun_F5560 family protein [Geitlerinema sp. PCC 9228]